MVACEVVTCGRGLKPLANETRSRGMVMAQSLMSVTGGCVVWDIAWDCLTLTLNEASSRFLREFLQTFLVFVQKVLRRRSASEVHIVK